MKKCIHCGAEVPEEEAVCPACGQSVTEEAQTSENQQAQPETEKGPETDEDTCEEKTDPQEDGAQEPAAETPAAAAPAQKKPPVWVWIVGRAARIRLSSVMAPVALSWGTLKSQRSRTFLPWTSTSRTDFLL